MLQVYIGDQIPDQDKDNSGDLLYGLQGANTYKPLAFNVPGDNSDIVSLDAVEYNQQRQEIDRISLSTSLIVIDLVNNIYKVDGSILYADLLKDGIYRFEFINLSEIFYKTEYFSVQEKEVLIKFDNNELTWDSDLITFDQIKYTI